MRTHLLLCLPILLAPLAAQQKPGEKPAAPAAADPNAISIQVLAPLEGIVKQLAKGGRERETKDLLVALEKLGYPKANHDKLEKACKDDLAKAKSVLDSLPAGAKQLRNTAKQIAVVMDKLEDAEAKKELAKKILMLDGNCEEAHKVLEHVKVGKNWVAPEMVPIRERRGKILEKIQQAKQLAVDVETEEMDDPIIQQACGVKATVVRRGRYEFRSNCSLEKTERMFREVMRAFALSRWLRGGKPEAEVALPPVQKIATKARAIYILIDSRERYRKVAEELIAAGKVPEDNMKAWGTPNTEVGGFNVKESTDYPGGAYVKLAQWETSVQELVLRSISEMKEDLPTPVSAGHLNWLTLTCFGTTLGNQFYNDEKQKGFGDTHVAGEEERDREELQRLAKAGIQGSRTWMRYLAERGEDPAFARSLVQAIPAITGNDLHKCTSIVEYLQEAGLFADAYKLLCKPASGRPMDRYTAALTSARSTRDEKEREAKAGDDETAPEAAAPAGDMTIGDLESKWKDWILGSQPGVAERIDKENLNAWPKEALEILAYMNSIREKTFKGKIEGVWKLKFDPDLSEQCAAHAHYLTLHPEQQKWPDAHEEYADKEGYTPEGSWAGTHSVIMWREGGDGPATFQEGIDGWLGTFYHRLPLVDPGVLRLGWGAEEIYQVMDMSSLATPYDKPFVVVYPYDGQTGVPSAFQGNEFPDPVPDGAPGSVNEGEIFGYPVTIQTRPVDEKNETVDIEMHLFDGKTEVECHFSTPSKPTNPESAPGGAWCLIPKKALKAKTEYKVVADWKLGGRGSGTSAGKHLEWTFKTE